MDDPIKDLLFIHQSVSFPIFTLYISFPSLFHILSFSTLIIINKKRKMKIFYINDVCNDIVN